jgi:predicted amidophosphoribosyltransferase
MDPLRRAHIGLPYVCAPCHAALPWRDAGGTDAVGTEAVGTEAGGTQSEGAEAGSAVSAAAGAVERVWAPWRYEEPVRRWVHGLKYDGRDALAMALGRLAAGDPRAAAALEGVDLVAPVPLHRRRLRERGFNQAALIAHHWLRGLAQRGCATPPLVPDLLARTRYTTPQVELDEAQRAANVAGAFGAGRAWRHWAGRSGPFRRAGAAERAGQPEGLPLAGLRVLLVDDVMTTGATMAACAQVLREAGAAAVDALVMARTA